MSGRINRSAALQEMRVELKERILRLLRLEAEGKPRSVTEFMQ